MQAEAEVHATEFKNVACAPGRCGVGTTLQLVPFHRSESGDGCPARLKKSPTAMQSDGPGQDTLSRLPPAGAIPGGLGTGTMCQSFPFQCSAPSACRGELSVPVPPTAMQLDGLGQDTPTKLLASAPGRLGVFWIVQVLPFQDSARLTSVLKPLAEGPAAMQNEGMGHETAENPLAEAWVRLGVGWMDHLVPSQCSARVPTGVPVLSVGAPTAVQAETDVHDTAFRELNCAPDGLGVAWIAQ